ncbi:hypothetical protein [Streptomyces sp. NPDC096032]|uniref:hypothetical protein n=1 Tax=Streptomyces sp. NPDC096032 TaxID=3366070 RepID=UPI00381B9DAA
MSPDAHHPAPEDLRRDPLPLLGRRALVTGAGRRAGIGHAVARRPAAYGAAVHLHRHVPHDERPQRPRRHPGRGRRRDAGRAHAAVAARFPAGRWGLPDDPARLVAWPATDEAGWITGEDINCEGRLRR